MRSFRPFPQNRIDDVPSVSIDISDTHKLTSSDTRHPVLYRIISIILSLNDNASGLLHTSSIDSYSFLVIANSHFLRTAGPHFPDGSGHIKRTAWEISRAEGTPPY